MLVLRCREGESVSIGDDIQLSVLAVDAGRVKLGFTAPASVPVSRRCAELTREHNKGALRVEGAVLGSLKSYLSNAPKGHLDCVVSVASTANEEQLEIISKTFGPAAEE